MLHSIAPARHLRRRAVQHQTRPEWTLESDLQCDQRIQEISARIGRVTGGRHCCQPPQELSQASSLRRAVCGVGSQCLQSRSRYRRDGIGDAVSVARECRPLHCDLRHRITGRCVVGSLFDLCEIPKMAHDFFFCMCGRRLFCSHLMAGRAFVPRCRRMLNYPEST